MFSVLIACMRFGCTSGGRVAVVDLGAFLRTRVDDGVVGFSGGIYIWILNFLFCCIIV